MAKFWKGGKMRPKEGTIITVPPRTVLLGGLLGGDSDPFFTDRETRLVIQPTAERVIGNNGVVAVRIESSSLEKGKPDPGILYLAEEAVKTLTSA